MDSIRKCLAIFVFVGAITLIYSQEPEHSGIGKNKKIVTYLGTDFILRDGCPVVNCDPKNRYCRKLQLDTQNKYNKCLRKEAESRNGTINEQGIMEDEQGNVMDPYLGCVTDHLPDADITVPVFAKYCSTECYYLVPYDSIFYYEHEEKDKKAQTDLLEEPGKPKTFRGIGDSAPRQQRIHICPYVGREHHNVDPNLQRLF